MGKYALKTEVEDAIKNSHAHENEEALSKLSTDENGNLLYNGTNIHDVDLSTEAGNAAKMIDGKLDYRYPNSQTFEIVAKHQTPVLYGLDCHNPKTFDDFYPYIKELKEEFKDFSLNYIEQCPLEKVS